MGYLACAMKLRRSAGQAGYEETFIQHWLHEVLFYDFSPWVFTLAYTVFALLILFLWFTDRRDGQDQQKGSNR